MGTTYIVSGVGKLGKESQHLVMKDVEGNCTKILPSKTDQLVLVGNVSISGDALWLLAQKKIPTICQKILDFITLKQKKIFQEFRK